MFDLNELVACLEVEQLDTYLFRGRSLKLPLPKMFGGQVVAQALNAAARTVDPSRRCHSLHAYFLRPGDDDLPIIIDVDPIRDGGSFTTRRVVVKQNSKAIFNCSMSFQTCEEGFEHQQPMPLDVPDPETLLTDDEWRERWLREYPDARRPLQFPIEVIDIRRVNHVAIPDMEPNLPTQGMWFKFCPLGNYDSPVVRQTLLAFISDLGLMTTALRPQGIPMTSPKLMGSSLDHAMWFHTDIKLGDWLYYDMDSPRSMGGRGFNRGSFYARDGNLMASVTQEGLMRLVKK